MSGVNKAIILGNLGRDPETRYSRDGKPITNFSVATSQKYQDKEQTEWHNVVCFGRLAEISGEYLRKGSKVYVEGALRTSSWEKDGQKHYKTEIIAGQLQMLSSGERSLEERVSDAEKHVAGLPVSSGDLDDDLPFMTHEKGWLV
jgi:single-strand DNA-binding protein